MSEKLKKIINIENLPILLFIIIIINFIPLGLPNSISKDSYAAGTIPTIIGFLLEVIILICAFWKKVIITEEMKKNIIMLSIISFILLIVQIVNVILGNGNLKDFANIACKIINISLLFIAMFSIKVREEKIQQFMKCIIFFATIACIHNIIVYFREILSLITLSTVEDLAIKGFFGNRNQLAFFLYIAICSNVFVILKNKHIGYKITLALFIVNLILTMSRTGIIAIAIFLVLYYFINDKISKKIKIGSIMLGIIGILTILLILQCVKPQILQGISAQLLRPETVHNLSGRTAIWQVGAEVLTSRPSNLLVGVGRFEGIEAIKESGKKFRQFHNVYIETLVSGGIMELAYIIFIYFTVFKKVLKSNLNNRYKQIYACMFISYYIYILFESFGRFSIGYADTLCMIYFISIPLLHVNSVKIKTIEGKKENDNIKINT